MGNVGDSDPVGSIQIGFNVKNLEKFYQKSGFARRVGFADFPPPETDVWTTV